MLPVQFPRKTPKNCPEIISYLEIPLCRSVLPFERRERQLLCELRDSGKRRRAKASFRRLQAEKVEDEEAAEGSADGEPVLSRFLRRVFRPELA